MQMYLSVIGNETNKVHTTTSHCLWVASFYVKRHFFEKMRNKKCEVKEWCRVTIKLTSFHGPKMGYLDNNHLKRF